MGGRGTKLNVDTYLGRSHEDRISEYESIYVDGNIKFLMQKDGTRITTPVFSNTEGRIYVTLRPDGTIAGITQYDQNHRQVFSIHEPHKTEKDGDVHIHSSLESGRTKIKWDDMKKEYRDLYLSIKQKYQEFNISEKVKEYNNKHGR